MFALLPGSSLAAESAARFAIPAGTPMGQALTRFAEQSDHDILFTPDVVAGHRTRGVSGAMEASAALDALLQGSGLTWREFQGRYLVERGRHPQPADQALYASDPEVASLVVTALRRPTLERLTPMSMRVFSGEDLSRAGVVTFSEAADMTPGLTQTQTGTGRNRLSLRGVYGAGEATTALYYDDVPVTGSSGTTADPGGSAPEFLLLDVARLEVLRGPQGTLYGASAMGGALKVVFNRPDLSMASGVVSANAVTHGGQGAAGGVLVINQPMVLDRVGIRLTAYRQDDPAYVENARLGLSDINRSVLWGGRLGLRALLTDDLTLDLTLAYQDTDLADTSGGWASAPPHVSYAYVRTPFEGEMALYQGGVTWNIGSVSLAASAAAYRWDSTRYIDYTGTLQTERLSSEGCQRYIQPSALACTPAQLDLYAAYVDSRSPGLLYQPIQLDAKVQEIHLQSQTTGFLAWTVGLFREVRNDVIDSQVLAAEPQTGLPRPAAGFTGRRIVDSRLTQRAAYGEVTFGADRDTALVLGARHFEYEKLTRGVALVVNVISNTTDANFRTATRETGWSLKVLASHKFSPTTLAYVQASQGFRPGGVNPAPGLPDDLSVYGADSLWNYEVGFKGGWFDNRLTLDAALFRIDWQDMQYTAASANGAFSFITNVGEARVLGLEADATLFLGPSLRGGANLTLTDAVLTSDQASASGAGLGSAGDRIPAAPHLAAGGWLERRLDLQNGWRLHLRSDVSYAGRSNSTFKPGGAGDTALGDFWLLKLRATLEADDWTLAAFVDNATDSHAAEFASTGRYPITYAPRPRRFGASATYAF
ncbi:TonB-dependent receptor [Phenylobacterium sp.]|uniref:TonB-dependent receptor domain-containing protein n=1 Tax=Phenylobacterium sp. TaxID=1871053 RepID=UPI002731DC9F|nr:TonB-dependent receptor [Phenylobacterium sp.]MDP2213599.1 TonB-dependent receptor [Phenylobacterium sp.]